MLENGSDSVARLNDSCRIDTSYDFWWLDSARVTLRKMMSRVESRWGKWWVESSHIFHRMTRLDSSHNQWLENRHFYKIIFTKSLNSWWTTQFVGKQANEHFLFEWWSWWVQSFCIYSLVSLFASELGLLIRGS